MIANVLALAAVLGFGMGCGDPEPGEPMRPDGPEAAYVTEARDAFPTAFDVQTEILATKCSPNPGVCHSASTYPDLRTMGALVAMIEAPCNVEIPDPSQGWDGCEREPHRIATADFESDIGRFEKVGSGHYSLRLRDAPEQTDSAIAEIRTADDQVLVVAFDDYRTELDTVAGSRDAELVMRLDDASQKQWFDSIVAGVIAGDGNDNDVWGLDDDESGAVILPGSLERSYLWGRITATVPGSRMPLANDALTNPEYVAIACWIETLAELPFPRGSDPINYDDCVFAWYPVEYAIDQTASD